MILVVGMSYLVPKIKLQFIKEILLGLIKKVLNGNSLVDIGYIGLLIHGGTIGLI